MALTGRSSAGWSMLLLSALLALAAWGLAVILAAQPRWKQLWDVSPQARFSVEPATAELLAQLRQSGQRVELHTLYVPLGAIAVTGPEAEQWRSLHQRLHDLTTDLLRQYAYLGGDAIEVTHHDLLREPAKVKEVLREVGKRNYDTVIVKLGKRSRVLSLLDDLAELDVPLSAQTPVPGARPAVPTLKSYKGEEALSSALKGLLVEGTPKIYFLAEGDASLSAGIAASYSELTGALADDGFAIDVLDLRREGRVPADATAIALVEPHRDLSAQDSEVLWGYLRRGGRVLINVVYTPQPVEWNPRLLELGQRLGFALSDDLVCHGVQDPNDPSRFGQGSQMVANIVAVNMSASHPVTRPLLLRRRYPLLKNAREIVAVGGAVAGVQLDTSILRSGPWAWREERLAASGNPDDVAFDWIGPSDAAAYTSRCVAAIAEVEPEQGDRRGRFVLLAAAAFDNLGFAQNGDLALNLFNWMAEREALVSVRGDKYVARDLVLAPQQLERTFWLLVGGVPGAMLLLALIVVLRRSRG